MEITIMVEKIKDGEVPDYIWKSILEKMYDDQDQATVETTIQNQLKYRKKYPIGSRNGTKNYSFENAVMNMLADKFKDPK